MTMDTNAKDTLKRYLHAAREALLWKLDGLTEREARMPRTPTGTSLSGIVKHALNVEAGYFGETFGRDYPDPADLVDPAAADVDPHADWVAGEEETVAVLSDRYQRVAAFCDQVIDSLPLDAPGRVSWWGDKGAVTLHEILVHVISDLTRHAGHADILREQLDGAVGLREQHPNLPAGQDWPAHVARVREIAERF